VFLEESNGTTSQQQFFLKTATKDLASVEELACTFSLASARLLPATGYPTEAPDLL